ncbi:hypothetical protein D3C72_1703550 [compost metagenome]
MQIDFRVVGQKCAEHCRQQGAGGHGGSGQTQGDAPLTGEFLEGVFKRLRFAKHTAGGLQYQAAGRRELHTIGLAGEHGNTVALLEQAQTGTGGRDSHRDAGGGLAQTAGGSNGGQQA